MEAGIDLFKTIGSTVNRMERKTMAGACWEFASVVSRCADRQTAVTEILRRIANSLEVDVCSIYLLDDQTGDLVLAATMGLNQSSVGQVRMSRTAGLVGLVAQEIQPVFAENALEHPRFLFFPEAGEEPFVSFFGVPILLHGTILGVLVVQTVEPRNLSLDWAVVATAAQQVAPFVRSAASFV